MTYCSATPTVSIPQKQRRLPPFACVSFSRNASVPVTCSENFVFSSKIQQQKNDGSLLIGTGVKSRVQ
jgi:hypothetical protein